MESVVYGRKIKETLRQNDGNVNEREREKIAVTLEEKWSSRIKASRKLEETARQTTN